MICCSKNILLHQLCLAAAHQAGAWGGGWPARHFPQAFLGAGAAAAEDHSGGLPGRAVRVRLLLQETGGLHQEGGPSKPSYSFLHSIKKSSASILCSLYVNRIYKNFLFTLNQKIHCFYIVQLICE